MGRLLYSVVVGLEKDAGEVARWLMFSSAQDLRIKVVEFDVETVSWRVWLKYRDSSRRIRAVSRTAKTELEATAMLADFVRMAEQSEASESPDSVAGGNPSEGGEGDGA